MSLQHPLHIRQFIIWYHPEFDVRQISIKRDRWILFFFTKEFYNETIKFHCCKRSVFSKLRDTVRGQWLFWGGPVSLTSPPPPGYMLGSNVVAVIGGRFRENGIKILNYCAADAFYGFYFFLYLLFFNFLCPRFVRWYYAKPQTIINRMSSSSSSWK